MRSLSGQIALLATVLLLIGCQDAADPTPPPPALPVAPSSSPPADPPDGNTVAEVVIWLPPATIGVGETAHLQAWANAAQVGRVRATSPIVWSGEDQAVATVTAIREDATPGAIGGVDFWAALHGVGKGTVTVRAASGDVSSAVTIIVGEPAASIAISPTTLTLNATACQSMRLALSLHDAEGNRLDGRRAIWTSSDPNVANVFNALGDPANVVWVGGVNSGTITITASTGLISANAAVTVTGHLGRFGCMD